MADWYSSREMGTIAFRCPQAGQHVAETRYLEVVAGERVVEPGEMGEVVVTSLHQYSMPFVRYKMDDVAAYEPSPCTCGRGLPVLREVVGRTNDYLVTVDGRFVHPEFFAYAFRAKPEITRYQAYQPNKHHLEVRLVCKGVVDQAWLEGIRRGLQVRFGDNMRISCQIVDDIPLTSAGKHRFIVSETKPDFRARRAKPRGR